MLASLFPWALYLLAWACTIFAVKAGADLWQALLLFVVFFNGGIQGLWSALGHLGFPKQSARSIGWKNSPFQSEVGFADLAIGIVGCACIFQRIWSYPVGLILAIFFTGCAYTHIKDIKNKAPCNSGPMLYNTVLVVITVLGSMIAPLLK